MAVTTSYAEAVERAAAHAGELVVVERDGARAVVTMNDPERLNPLSAELTVQLRRRLEELARDEALRSIILTGTDPAFSAGGDLRLMRDTAQPMLAEGAGAPGAHGGVLREVRFARFQYRGEAPRLWSDVGPATLLLSHPNWNRYETFTNEAPLALEAGDVKTRWLVGLWQGSNDETEHDPGQAPALSYAEKLRGLRGIKVDIEWDYRRVAGGWRSLIPGKMGRRRETVTESTTVELDGTAWIEAVRRMWEDAPYQPPINVLEGRASDDDGAAA